MTSTIKTDFPPFRMEIIGGRLSPVSQFDAERLDSFSGNRELQVYVTQEPNRALQRKYFAILNKVVKECKTPWKNAAQASDALKLAWGHVSRFKNISGGWSFAPKSLNDFDDDDFSQFFEESMATLERLTGVDPLTLQAEAASTDTPQDNESDAGQSGSEASPESPPVDVEAGDSQPHPSPASEIQESAAHSSSQPYTIVDYARQLLHTASTIMEDERFKPLNVGEAKEAMKPTVSLEQKKLGKDLDAKTKELVKFTHGIVEAVLRGDRRPGAARSAISGQMQTVAGLDVGPDDLVMEPD